ncbi:hypothetical protein A2Z22_01170 [Candidatus Woesebacteria bacterium RBG_16_34_12]|uniref:Uncharacterized protein n=1 Tax=Candidatus Woesebacteria bacterium RBG_16_34_12 TaxID=1802480 RepID=A0A1F7X8J7_9BACT|nr:MAG: hypothetical protein A2Z22_01170 [Candidatus Woesebacteria bacterium RBG_16_34_12]
MKTVFLRRILYFVLIFIVYFFYPKFIAEAIILVMSMELIYALSIAYKNRNNKDHRAYLLFHPTKFIRIGFIICIILAIILYFIG